MTGPRWAVVAICILTAAPARAHSPVPGIEGFYTGLLHPFSTPAQALTMIALGLMIGAVPTHSARLPLAGFAVATCVGAAVWTLLDPLDPVLFAVACASAALMALAPGAWRPVVTALMIAGGLLIGMASMPDPGPVRDRAFTLAGGLVGANMGLMYLAGLSFLIRQRYPAPWVGIGLRVLAAWSATISLLMLALWWQ